MSFNSPVALIGCLVVLVSTGCGNRPPPAPDRLTEAVRKCSVIVDSAFNPDAGENRTFGEARKQIDDDIALLEEMIREVQFETTEHGNRYTVTLKHLRLCQSLLRAEKIRDNCHVSLLALNEFGDRLMKQAGSGSRSLMDRMSENLKQSIKAMEELDKATVELRQLTKDYIAAEMQLMAYYPDEILLTNAALNAIASRPLYTESIRETKAALEQ